MQFHILYVLRNLNIVRVDNLCIYIYYGLALSRTDSSVLESRKNMHGKVLPRAILYTRGAHTKYIIIQHRLLRLYLYESSI